MQLFKIQNKIKISNINIILGALKNKIKIFTHFLSKHRIIHNKKNHLNLKVFLNKLADLKRRITYINHE